MSSGEIGGAIDDESECALVVVLAQQRHCVAEILVFEPGIATRNWFV